MLQRLGIRGKILAVVAVPILVLVLAAGVITFGSVQDLNQARNSEDLIDTLDRARSLEADLQDERYETATFAHVVQDAEERLTDSYRFTQTALDNVNARLSVLEGEGFEGGDEVRDRVNAAISRNADGYLASQRGVGISAPNDESNGWVVFPSEQEITTMQSEYATAGAALESLQESLSDDLGLNGPLSALAFRLNVESELATELFTTPLEYISRIESASTKVDNGIESLRGSIDELSGNEANERAIEALQAGEAVLADLGRIRTDSRSLALGAVGVTEYFTDAIETIVESADDVAVGMSDRELVSAVQAYGDLDALAENIKYEEIVIERLIRSGDFLPGEAAQARTMMAQTDISLGDAQDSVRGIRGFEEVPDFGASVSATAGDAGSFNSVRAQVLTGLDASLYSARTADWPSQVSEELAVYEPLRENMWNLVESRAGSNAQNALVSTIITTIAIAAVVVVSIVVALTIARRIIGPLRRLTTTATAVQHELPRLVERVAIPGETVDVSEVQIPVESQDEIGRLAEAFNGVNAATLGIAGEQAALRGSISEMFVNVARRDQVLLNRQLASIDEMERSEDDQETLTKLFALDHLATRMRRNSESLLVLAGIDTGRRLRRPMPLSDVVRTASSEIELYERVQLELDVDPPMLGHSALTAAHLFAELLENATVFSDPGTAVIVRTAERGGEFVVEIEDSGIGMTEKELFDANNRVASTAASEILGAQRLGLFVVGRIARRIGAHVEIRSEEGSGTLAIVTMPRALFAKEEDQAPQHISSNAVDEATHAPAALVSRNESDQIFDSPRQPEPAEPRAGAYAPTALQEGTSLSERPETSSIEDLIAADAANAPVGQQTNPQELTAGSAASGLPARRRREAPSPADEQRERQSIVGLPARATDAQLSALAAEQATGFTPAISPSEVAPQSPEQRSSVFRGFRSRRDNEEHAASGAPSSFTPELPKRERTAPSAPEPSALPSRRDASSASSGFAPAPSAQSAPAPTYQAPPARPAPAAPSAPGLPSSGPGGSAAGAAGAAAFFSRRSREANEQGLQAEQAAAPAIAPNFDFSPEPPAAQDLTGAAAPQAHAAPESAVAQPVEQAEPWREPVREDFGDQAAAAAPPAPTPTPGDGLPVFRMPKLDIPVPQTDRAPSAPSAPHEPMQAELPQLAFDDAPVTGEVRTQAYVQPQEQSPFVVPALESDEDEAAAPEPPVAPWAQQQVAPSYETPPSYDNAPSYDAAPSYEAPAEAPRLEADPSPYGGVEQVSLAEEQAPQAPSSHVPSPYDAPAQQSAPSTEHPRRRWYEQPGAQTDAEPAADSAPAPGFFSTQAAAPQAAPSAPQAPVQPPVAQSTQEYTEQAPAAYSAPSAPQAPVEPPAATPATPWGYQAERAQENPSLDALIQSAVDDDTEQRPGFFSRLFGRGRSNDSSSNTASESPKSGSASQWAATDAPRSAPSAAPAAGAFRPVASEPPTPVSWRSAPAPASAPEPTAGGYRASAASAPATQSAPAPFTTQPPPSPVASQPVTDSRAPWTQQSSAHSVPSAQEPRRIEHPPWEKPRTESPAQPAFGTPPGYEQQAPSSAPANPWETQQPATQEQAAPTSFSPEQLAKPAGWEAAGASALEAAQPERGTSYQPVLQPETTDDGDGGGDITSAVFSEFSSLASERPKVEKTRAGLQRRRATDAKPVEVRPIEEDVSLAPADRDADAVRNRFSSFYSGTQRARDDVAAFAHQTEPAEATDT